MNEPVTVRQTGSAPFRARARLIRLLGEELISDEAMAIIELVKNGYDADARLVTVELRDVTVPDQGTILIRDNGSGMDLHTLLHSWMEPATPRKRARGQHKTRTPLGRIQLGEKGVGRFAADKLGSELEVITRLSGAEDEIALRVSWHHFDHDRYLDEVENTWVTREPSDFIDTTGTLLRIRCLRSVWTGEMVERLHSGLKRLITPSSNSADFAIEIRTTEFPFANGRVVNTLAERAPYRLRGTVDAAGVLTVEGSNRQIDLRRRSPERFIESNGELRASTCGQFSVNLNVWDMEPINREGRGVDKGLRQIIKAMAGVSIYRDNFRIWPYGEKDDDWLELNQRRLNNTTQRISNNQIVGFVEITHICNPDLRDRTSREGLLETPAFFDMRALVLAAISELEDERFAIRRPSVPAVAPVADSEDEILNYLVSLRNGIADGGTSLRGQLQEMERLYRQRLEQERNRYNYVSRLAGVGMAAERVTDSFSRQVLHTTGLLRILQGELTASENERLRSLVDQLAMQMDSLNEQLDLMGPLYRPSIQDTGQVNLYGATYDVLSILSGNIQEAGIRIVLGGDRRLAIGMNAGHLMQVLMILIENATQSLVESRTPDAQISVQISSEGELPGIVIADNGPGVPAGVQKLIFEPYFSTRQAGRGLGLHVARDILASYNSTVKLLTESPPPAGACFEIRFDRRRITGKAQ